MSTTEDWPPFVWRTFNFLFWSRNLFLSVFFFFDFDRICGRATNCSGIRFDWLHRRKRNYSRAKRNFTRVPVWRGWKKVCTSWSKLLLGNGNGLFLAISHFNNTNLRLRFILKLSCVTRKGTLMTIFFKLRFHDTWLVSLLKHSAKKLELYLFFFFAEFCHFLFHANHTLHIDMPNFDWPSHKTMQMSLVSLFSWCSSINVFRSFLSREIQDQK